MTVCIATLFTWNYAPLGEEPKFGWAAITASDQMITAGDIQYEPFQQKMAAFTPKTLLLAAGDYATNSEAIQITQKQIKGRADESPYNIARIYGQVIQGIKRRNAEDIILAPLGLNTDTFLSQQKEMSDYFANDLKEQLQRFQGQEVEAIIVGSDGGNAHIYEIDSRGTVSCMDDVAFHAIGAGAWHAKSHLMQTRYSRGNFYAYALAQTYSAKRRAEIAPGVGRRTDIHLVLKDGWFRLPGETLAKLDELYDEYTSQQSKLAVESVIKLQEFINAQAKEVGTGEQGDEEADGEVGELAPQATQGNDGVEAPRSVPNVENQEKGQRDA